jgi:hypothetical protein
VIYTLKLKHFIFLGLLLTIGSGCLTPGRLYIGNYHIKTKSAQEESFRTEAKDIMSKIATNLQYKYVVEKDAPWGLEISLYPQFRPLGSTSNKVLSLWVSRGSSFDIEILKQGPEEDEGTLWARSCIEKILNEHPEFQWKFTLDHRTMAR